MSVQTFEDQAGTSPKDAVQQYVDSFSSEAQAFSITPSVRYVLSGGEPTDAYEFYYSEYDPTKASGVGITGALYLFQRDDGLSALWDVWGTASVSPPSDAFQAFEHSIIDARLIDELHAPHAPRLRGQRRERFHPLTAARRPVRTRA